jgi:membrane protein
LTRWALAVLGIFAAGFLAGDTVKRPRRGIRRATDWMLRGLLFQSREESPTTEGRSASSLIVDVTTAVYSRFMAHSIMSVAAASAFFIVLAIFPGLAGLVALYGLLGNPGDISTFISTMPDIIPGDIIRLLQSFISQLILRTQTNLSTLMIAVFVALWSSNSAMKSLIESLNVVYERREKRSLLRLNILATVMTLTFLGFMLVAVNIMILPVWNLLLQTVGGELLRLRWVAMLFAMQVLISTLYYFAPCGRQKRWQLLTAGASMAAVSWVLMSMLFSVYLTNFANYSVTYGSLGAAAIFMTWLWLTVTILLTGAEIDAAITHLGGERP